MDNETKVCSKCKIEKSLIEFHKHKGYRDGYTNQCKTCRLLSAKKYREANREAVNKRIQEWRKNHPDYDKNYAIENRERKTVNKKRWRENGANKEKDKLHYKKWYKAHANEKRLMSSQYQKQNRDTVNKRCNQRKKEDTVYHLRTNISSMISKQLKRKNLKKDFTYADYVPFTIDELVKHLESQFEPAMTWDNYSYRGWHIDHICPSSLYDFSDKEEIRNCWSLKNLRPFWHNENISKSNKLDWTLVEQYALYDLLPKEITTFQV